MRKRRYLYGMASSLAWQIAAILSGLILPRIYISRFGSEVNGAAASIAQFLGYIVLLEGGIGGVARAALYKPLAEKNWEELSRVVSYLKHFFRIIALVFMGYALVLACAYRYIAKGNSFEWSFSFMLVIVISVSSLAEYYFGITYIVLLQADQKSYVQNVLSTAALAANTACVCFLAFRGAGIIAVKLACCGIHLVRIAALNLYIKRSYRIKRMPIERGCLPQKWDALGQHIAYFLHSHTDVVVLTVLANLREVSVYSVYNYIACGISSLVMIVGTNMEAVFGEMLARNEKEQLDGFFDLMEYMINSCMIVFFGTGYGLIMPFIALYTKGVTDADYYRPVVACLLLLSQALFCFRMPYHQLVTAAGHFRELKNAAFTEAGLNIVLSCALCFLWGIEGVVIATVLAVACRGICFIFYIRKNIICRNAWKTWKRFLVTAASIWISVILFGMTGKHMGGIAGYGQWIQRAALSALISVAVTLAGSLIFYKKEFLAFKNRILAAGRQYKNQKAEEEHIAENQYKRLVLKK